MKEKKDTLVGVKLNNTQVAVLDKIISEGNAKTRGGAIQFILNAIAIKDNYTSK